MTMPKPPSAEKLLQLSDNELYLRLGREFAGSEAVPQSIDTLIQKGRDAYGKIALHIAASICQGNEPHIDFNDLRDTTLISALTAWIVESGSFQLGHAAALYVATIIARAGLKSFCQSYGPGQLPPK
jgi:hypothetical protein